MQYLEMESTKPRKPIGFLDMPLEIRQQIYHSCLVRQSVIVVDHLRSDPDQFESLRFEKLLSEEPDFGDLISVIDEKKLEKSMREGLEAFQGVKENVDNKTDISNKDGSVCSDFAWWRVRYFSGVEPKTHSMVLVCKKISREATDVLYGCNAFRCVAHSDGGNCFKEHFSEANRRKIRKLEVILRPLGGFYLQGQMLDRELWSPIVEGLTHFSVIAQQPLSSGHYWFAGSLEEDMGKWIVWAGAVLEFLASRLHDDCQIFIDDDEREETSALVEKCFSRSYQRLQIRHGDFYFYRGYYGLGSEYC